MKDGCQVSVQRFIHNPLLVRVFFTLDICGPMALALGHSGPYENTSEIVAYVLYFERGFGLPCSNYFSGLLYYYGIQLHHLLPNSILYILSLYICAKLLWASSPTLSFSSIFSTTSHSQIQKKSPW